MSSSCPERYAIGRTLLASAVLLALPVAALGAETSYLPIAEVGVQTHTNRDLATGNEPKEDGEGYTAELGVDVRVRTPRSSTTVRPVVRLQEYPDSAGLEDTEFFLDLRNQFRTERGQFDLAARYSREDWFNAELPDAQFGEVIPDDPTVPQTGTATEGESRDRFNILPSYTHWFSERVGAGGSLLYEAARYDGGSGGGTDYDYGAADAFVAWKYDARTRLQVGPYVSRYEATDDSAKVDAYGLNATLDREWTQRIRSNFELGVYSHDAEYADPGLKDGSETGWMGRANVDWLSEVSRVRFGIGRAYSPSGRGVVTTDDEVRLQYDRDFSARLTGMAAARYLKDRAIGDVDQSNDYDFWRGEIGLRYFVASNWFVSGGYQYTWREYVTATESANDSSFMLSFGYSPLKPGRSRSVIKTD